MIVAENAQQMRTKRKNKCVDQRCILKFFFDRNMVELNFQLCRKYVPSSNLPLKIDAHVNKLQPNVFNKIHAKIIAES